MQKRTSQTRTKKSEQPARPIGADERDAGSAGSTIRDSQRVGEPTFRATDVITIMGKRGSGKTTLSRKLQNIFPRLVIFDRLHEYATEQGETVKTVRTFSEFADAIRDTVESARFKIIFQFDIEQDNHSEVFNQALRLLYYRGSVAIVIEEVWNFASPHFLPKWFEELLLTGRHRGCALITTSQRPAAIHKTILSQSHHIFCGTLHERNDLKYLTDVMGESVEQLPNLGQFRFLWFRPGQANKVVSN